MMEAGGPHDALRIDEPAEAAAAGGAEGGHERTGIGVEFFELRRLTGIARDPDLATGIDGCMAQDGAVCFLVDQDQLVNGVFNSCET